MYVYRLVPDREGDAEGNSPQSRLASLTVPLVDKKSKRNQKDTRDLLRACAWGLDLRYQPPVPLIFVGGTGKFVHVIQLLRRSPTEPNSFGLFLERSISGQGGVSDSNVLLRTSLLTKLVSICADHLGPRNPAEAAQLGHRCG